MSTAGPDGRPPILARLIISLECIRNGLSGDSHRGILLRTLRRSALGLGVSTKPATCIWLQHVRTTGMQEAQDFLGLYGADTSASVRAFFQVVGTIRQVLATFAYYKIIAIPPPLLQVMDASSLHATPPSTVRACSLFSPSFVVGVHQTAFRLAHLVLAALSSWRGPSCPSCSRCRAQHVGDVPIGVGDDAHRVAAAARILPETSFARQLVSPSQFGRRFDKPTDACVTKPSQGQHSAMNIFNMFRSRDRDATPQPLSRAIEVMGSERNCGSDWQAIRYRQSGSTPATAMPLPIF